MLLNSCAAIQSTVIMSIYVFIVRILGSVAVEAMLKKMMPACTHMPLGSARCTDSRKRLFSCVHRIKNVGYVNV